MAESTIIKKIWNIAGVLMDDGVSNSDYLEQITFLLFLKMIDENKKTDEAFRNFNDIPLPGDYSWDRLNAETGADLKKEYEKMLTEFSEQEGILGIIYHNAQNKIQTPARLKKVITMIDSVEWNTLGEDVKGDIYEGLLERVAQDIKSGAGQYFTPRPLIKAIVRCVNPQIGRRIADPCCGSGGFLIAAKQFLSEKYQITEGEYMEKLQKETFYGSEIVPNAYRLCLMNLLLHGIGSFDDKKSNIKLEDSLANKPTELSDYVLTNPPFGKKTSSTIEKEVKNEDTGEIEIKTSKEREVYSRDDFASITTNKQLNFLQHIKSMLKVGGTAAVVLPDNVLFESGAGETIRKNILKTCDLHTILRLPTGLFYAQGVKANVVFFEKKQPSEHPQTKEVWIYDYRTNIKHTLKQNPLAVQHLQEFLECYRPDDRHHRTETYNADTNPEGRWRRFTYDEIIARDKTSLDISWIKQGGENEDTPLSTLLDDIQQKSQNIAFAVQQLQQLLKTIEE